MEKFNFRGCDITILNGSNIVTDAQCVRFLSKYVSHYLSDEVIDGKTYIPYDVENRTPLLIQVFDDNITIKVFVNKDLHIEMQAYQFHNAQCECEMQNSIHMAFFENLHKWKLDGKDIMSI